MMIPVNIFVTSFRLQIYKIFRNCGNFAENILQFAVKQCQNVVSGTKKSPTGGRGRSLGED